MTRRRELSISQRFAISRGIVNPYQAAVAQERDRALDQALNCELPPAPQLPAYTLTDDPEDWWFPRDDEDF